MTPEPPADLDLAFEALVTAHYARLGAFAYRLVGSRAAAEDVVHEVLLRVWRRRHKFSFHDPLRYLYQAVRNEAESWRRHEVRERRDPAARLELTADSKFDAAQVAELDDLARL